MPEEEIRCYHAMLEKKVGFNFTPEMIVRSRCGVQARGDRWPLTFQGGISQSGSSTGPQPATHRSYYYHLSYHNECFIYCCFIKSYLFTIYVHTYAVNSELVLLCSWRHVKSILVRFKLKKRNSFCVLWHLSCDVLLDFQIWWLRWECTKKKPTKKQKKTTLVLCFLH